MMNKTPHLLVCISGHGYGHAAQVAPVLNILHQLVPRLRLTLRTTIAEAHLRRLITPEFHYIAESTDFGMRMLSALDVDVAASMLAYREFHADWQGRVEAEAATIAELAPDLVLSDVAYLPLAGAAALGIPSVAMCSLNWADIFRHFCHKESGADLIVQQIENAYAQSKAFLCLQPSMPMSWLSNRMSIGPVAGRASSRRQEINQRLGISAEHQLVLVSMGGIAMRMPVEHWPVMPNVRWLMQADWLADRQREDMSAFDTLGISFSELLASCDVLLTKPGYGAFAEAGCHGIRVLYVERGEWPEQEYLIQWLQHNGCCQKLSAAQAQSGDFGLELERILAQPKPAAIEPTGNMQAAEYIASLL
jgi:hypothetical protein